MYNVAFAIPPGALVDIVTVNRARFLAALARYSRVRQRDGAYDWGVFEDPAEEGRFVETFLTDSGLEHLRQHQRVTKADQDLERTVRRFQVGEGPKTTHLIGARSLL